MGDDRVELLQIVRGLRSLARGMGESGISDWPLGSALDMTRKHKESEDTKEKELPLFEPEERLRVTEALAVYKDLSSLESAIKGCVKCPLGRTRRKFVFGEGNPKAKLMFVGEAPGRDEDLQGRPFVGRAGQLLTKIIEAMGLKRQDVYITNVLKCRPPNNRTPVPEEIEKCWPHLVAQIRLIGPKVIVALGSPAAKTLLGTDMPIGALRGRFHDVDGIPVMPTYHPAYLLRNPNDKGKVWEDMKKVRDLLKTL